MNQEPTVGRIVHVYSEKDNFGPIAAVVTGVTDHTIDLSAFPPESEAWKIVGRNLVASKVAGKPEEDDLNDWHVWWEWPPRG